MRLTLMTSRCYSFFSFGDVVVSIRSGLRTGTSSCLFTAKRNFSSDITIDSATEEVHALVPIPDSSDSNKQEKICPEVVKELDKHIIGQTEAKRSLAIALRDRWRRERITDTNLRNEVTPNNILLVGPSGTGKTELAKRLAAFAQAPFVKVVATRYTEVGFVGDDTQSMVQDLADEALEFERNILRQKFCKMAKEKAFVTIASAVLNEPGFKDLSEYTAIENLKDGRINLLEIDLDSSFLTKPESRRPNPVADMFSSLTGGRNGARGMSVGVAVPGMSAFDLSRLFDATKVKENKPLKKRITVQDAMPLVEEYHLNQLVNAEDVNDLARKAAEEKGIIFIDEFDKLIDSANDDKSGFSSKKRGVQKELLTLMEGCTVNCSIGRISTENILFIASGAFTSSKPSDVLPELQGRLPIRCELLPLTEKDFVRILTETQYNLILQQQALLASENIKLEFTPDSVEEIAKTAYHLNSVSANVGARRLKTVMAKLLENTKFIAHELSGKTVTISKESVRSTLDSLLKQSDLSKYII